MVTFLNDNFVDKVKVEQPIYFTAKPREKSSLTTDKAKSMRKLTGGTVSKSTTSLPDLKFNKKPEQPPAIMASQRSMNQLSTNVVSEYNSN